MYLSSAIPILSTRYGAFQFDNNDLRHGNLNVVLSIATVFNTKTDGHRASSFDYLFASTKDIQNRRLPVCAHHKSLGRRLGKIKEAMARSSSRCTESCIKSTKYVIPAALRLADLSRRKRPGEFIADSKETESNQIVLIVKSRV